MSTRTIEVTTSNRQVNKKRWFGLGKPVEAKTIDDVLEQGGIDWTVSKRPIATTVSPSNFRQDDKAQRFPIGLHPLGTRRNINLIDAAQALADQPHSEQNRTILRDVLQDMKEPPFIPMLRDYAVVRDDLNIPLGVLGAGYSCIPNRDSLSILENLMEQGRLTVERVGTFNGGANVWVVAKLPQSITVGPDVMDQYIKLSWSHDGTEKLSATFIAYMRKANIQLSPKIENVKVSIEIRHTKNAKLRIRLAEKLLEQGGVYFSGIEDKLTELISSSMTTDQMETYLEALLPDPPEKVEIDRNGERINKASKRNENNRSRILEIFAKSDTDVSHTKYAGMMSVAEWCDNERTVRVTSKGKEVNSESDEDTLRKESRLQGSWQKGGSSRKMKEAAFDLIFG